MKMINIYKGKIMMKTIKIEKNYNKINIIKYNNENNNSKIFLTRRRLCERRACER